MLRLPAEPPADDLVPRCPGPAQACLVGNLYLTDKRGAAEFSPADQRLVELFARHAGIAIDNARLHAQAVLMAVAEERDRIGRDLHDGSSSRCMPSGSRSRTSPS